MENIRWLAVIGFIALVTAVTMLLNGIPANEIGYGMLLCGFVMVVALLIGYGRHRESFRQLSQMQETIVAAPEDMKTPEYMYEKQYQACIRAIAQEKDRLQKEMNNRQRDLSEYYSMWVHQVKTPIAALKLLLDEEMNACLDADGMEENDTCVINLRQKQNELFRIEQYVDMALQYTRLGAPSNDFVIERVLLDAAIKPSIHKYAKQFIHKQLRLDYVPQEVRAVTDQKWLGFVIDQLLSNAVKYTKQGGVTIRVFTTSGPQTGSGGEQGVSDMHKEWYERTPAHVEQGVSDMHKEWYERTPAHVEQGVSDMHKEWYERTPAHGEQVHILIEDTGIGISADDLPRVCEMGYTGCNGHADQYSTGIGLYLCRAILNKLGHQFILTSKQGQGTRAEIVF